MGSQKYENMLNLALETPIAEREKAKTLNVGFSSDEKTWDVIVRYNGSLDFLIDLGVKIVYLAGDYAILTVPDNLINTLSTFEQIIYVEMPKTLYFSAINGVRESCINEVQTDNFTSGKVSGGLFGQGVICAIIDSGIDYTHPAFLDSNGDTRILELWDQNGQGTPPEGYNMGTVYTTAQINEAISETSLSARNKIVPEVDYSGHGTHVAGIMAGNFSQNRTDNIGIATKSPLIVVKLNNTIDNGYPRTTELMQAIDYVYKAAVRYRMPVSINISIGNSYGSHDGTALLETFIDNIASLWKMCISIGTGNEGNAGGHSLEIFRNGERKKIEFGVGQFESSLNIQIWKAYEDTYTFQIFIPGERNSITINNISGSSTYHLGNTTILIYYGEPSPYSPFQEIFIELIPISVNQPYLTTGIWEIDVTANNIINGRIDMWLPDSSAINQDTVFLQPDPSVTLTIPSTSNKCISVGAYNALSFSYADFSGRGYTRVTDQVRPDIVAPGVDIVSAAVGGGVVTKSGTSMATPFVSGSAALLMEWGIVRGNDPYLYGEKVKAYFIKGARKLTGFNQYPNPQLGWGALCVRESLPN